MPAFKDGFPESEEILPPFLFQTEPLVPLLLVKEVRPQKSRQQVLQTAHGVFPVRNLLWGTRLWPENVMEFPFWRTR